MSNHYGIKINNPIVYRFVRYNDKGYLAQEGDIITLGTFHEWNSKYYIDISVDLYRTSQLQRTVEHETRHMIVEYLKDQNIIDLSKYTEEIAQEKNEHYKTLLNEGVYLWKVKMLKEGRLDGQI